MKLSTCLAMMAVFGATVTVCADTYTWTGAENGFWTNVNNWAEGTVPGRYYDASKALVGQVGDIAVFGDGLTGNAVKTIDFDGVYSVRQILTQGTNRYTYGTSEGQNVPIEPFGIFSAAETETTPVARLGAVLQVGVECMVTNWGGDMVTVRNNSREELVIGKWGASTRSPNTKGGGGEPSTRFLGSGDFRLDGEFVYKIGHHMLRLGLTGKLTVNARTPLRFFDVQAMDGTPLEIEITENGTIEPISCYNWTGIGRRTRIYGAGPFKFGVGLRSGAGVICENSLSSSLTLECPVENKFIGGQPPDGYLQRLFWRAGGGTLRMSGGSTIQGRVQALSPNAGTLIVDTFGPKGTSGSFGDVDFELGHNQVLRYVGAGETTDRDIILSRLNSTAKGQGVLEQMGTGTLIVNSSVTISSLVSEGVLTLRGSGPATATFSGTLADTVQILKDGTGTWRFAPQGDYGNKISMQGGRLEIGKSMHISELLVPAGNSTLVIEDGCTLDADALSITSGKTLDFILAGDGAQLKLRNQTPGMVLTGVTLNGHPTVVTEELGLEPVPNSAAIWKSPVSGGMMASENWLWNLAPSAERDTFIDAPGDDYTVTFDSGSLVLTNLVVANPGNGVATLLVTNGATLEVKGHTTSQQVLKVGTGGHVDVVDATLRIVDQGNAKGQISDRSPLNVDGGMISVRGAGVLADYGIAVSLSPDWTVNRNSHFNFGPGDVTFEDDASFKLEQETNKTVFYHYVKSSAGKTTRVVFRGRSYPLFTVATPWNLHVQGNGGRAVLEFDTDYASTMKNLWNQTFVGVSGVGEILYKKGSFENGSYDMYHIATCPGDGKTTWTGCVTGRVEVAAAAKLKIYGQNPLATSYAGFTVGHADMLTGARGTSYLRGELTIAGQLTQGCGNFIVGEGPNADGEVRQTGGSFQAMPVEVPVGNKLGEVAIGIHGAKGRYFLEDGVFRTTRNVYIGGATTNDMHRPHANAAVLQQYHDADGAVSISAGSFTSTRNIILGRDGTGVINLSGTGTVAAASIIVSNTVGQAASGLTFTADAAANCGRIDPATKLVFLPGAKVTVDVTVQATAASPRRVVVWNLDEAPEGVADLDLTLLGAEGMKSPNSLELSADGKVLAWNVSRATMLIFR